MSLFSCFEAVRINVQIDTHDKKIMRLGYMIGADQIETMRTGRAPMPTDIAASIDYEMRCKRARTMAEMIAADLAHALIKAINPDASDHG